MRPSDPKIHENKKKPPKVYKPTLVKVYGTQWLPKSIKHNDPKVNENSSLKYISPNPLSVGFNDSWKHLRSSDVPKVYVNQRHPNNFPKQMGPNYPQRAICLIVRWIRTHQPLTRQWWQQFGFWTCCTIGKTPLCAQHPPPTLPHPWPKKRLHQRRICLSPGKECDLKKNLNFLRKKICILWNNKK